jgi:hypothetical protein
VIQASVKTIALSGALLLAACAGQARAVGEIHPARFRRDHRGADFKGLHN